MFGDHLRKAGAAQAIVVAMALAAGPAFAAEKALAPETNPPGDIPDTQVFIDYQSPDGFSMKVPEGWARTDMANGASFQDKLDGVVVTVAPASSAPTVDEVKNSNVATMARQGRALEVSKVESVDLPAGKAVRIVYSKNSEPNAVTNKQVRLEDNRYLYFKNGKLATVDLYAPKGADNVDQWQLMSRSFRWN